MFNRIDSDGSGQLTLEQLVQAAELIKLGGHSADTGGLFCNHLLWRYWVWAVESAR